VQAAVFLSVLIVTSLRRRWRGAGLSTTTDALASETCGSAQTG
jgi:hypothetical protein